MTPPIDIISTALEPAHSRPDLFFPYFVTAELLSLLRWPTSSLAFCPSFSFSLSLLSISLEKGKYTSTRIYCVHTIRLILNEVPRGFHRVMQEWCLSDYRRIRLARLTGPFSVLRRYMRWRQGNRTKATRAIGRLHHRQMARSFTRLVENVHERVANRWKVQQSVNRLARASMVRCMSNLKHCCVVRKNARAVLTQAITRYRQKYLLTGMLAMKQQVALARLQQDHNRGINHRRQVQIQLCIQRFEHNRCAQIFYQWRSSFYCRHRTNRILHGCTQRRQTRLSSWFIQRWKYRTQRRKTARTVFAGTLRRLYLRTLQWGFTRLQHTTEVKQIELNMQAAVAGHQVATLQHHLALEKRKLKMVGRFTRRHQLRMKWEAWRQFATIARKIRRRKVAKKRALRRWTYRRLVSSFHTLQVRTFRRMRLRATLKSILSRWKAREQRRGFRHLQIYVSEMSDTERREARCHRGIALLRYRIVRRRMEHHFQNWQALVATNRAHRMQIQQAHHHTQQHQQRRAIDRWKRVTREERRLAELTRQQRVQLSRLAMRRRHIGQRKILQVLSARCHHRRRCRGTLIKFAKRYENEGRKHALQLLRQHSQRRAFDEEISYLKEAIIWSDGQLRDHLQRTASRERVWEEQETQWEEQEQEWIKKQQAWETDWAAVSSYALAVDPGGNLLTNSSSSSPPPPQALGRTTTTAYWRSLKDEMNKETRGGGCHRPFPSPRCSVTLPSFTPIGFGVSPIDHGRRTRGSARRRRGRGCHGASCSSPERDNQRPLPRAARKREKRRGRLDWDGEREKNDVARKWRSTRRRDARRG